MKNSSNLGIWPFSIVFISETVRWRKSACDFNSNKWKSHQCGCERMVVGVATTYAIRAYHH